MKDKVDFYRFAQASSLGKFANDDAIHSIRGGVRGSIA